MFVFIAPKNQSTSQKLGTKGDFIFCQITDDKKTKHTTLCEEDLHRSKLLLKRKKLNLVLPGVRLLSGGGVCVGVCERRPVCV